MNRMLDSTKTIHDRYFASIKETCSVLSDHFNINKFYYHKICDTGRFLVFDSNLDFTQSFDTQELFCEFKYYCHPKYHQAGIQLINVSDDLPQMQMEITKNCMQKFNGNLWVRLVQKTDTAVEEFGFHLAQSDNKQVSFLFNQAQQLVLIAKLFRERNASLFAALDEEPVDLLSIVGPSFFEDKIRISDPCCIARQKIQRELGMQSELCLSSAETATLHLLLQGFTASQIAKQVYRSRRSVEHRIESIKIKLDCHSRAELIQKGYEMEHNWGGVTV